MPPKHSFVMESKSCGRTVTAANSLLNQNKRSAYTHTGHPSLGFVVFFKLVLLAGLENIVSDRRLMTLT